MKRLLFTLCLLLTLLMCSHVCAESTVIPADDDDLVRILEEALEQSDYDYSCVTLNRDNKIIVVDIAMDGLTANVLALKELGADETYEPWAEMTEAMLTVYDGIRDMFSTVHRDDMRLILQVANDDACIREDYSTIRYSPLLSIGIYRIVSIDVMAE